MRTLLSSLILVAACSVPDKQPATTDGGTDAGVPTGDPDTTITVAPVEFSNSGTATFEFESNMPDARFVCSLDGEAPAACTSPFARALPDGTHAFSVRAVLSTGEGDDTPAEHLWSIDTVPPITTITEAPPAADNSTTVHFSFMSNEMFATFECSLDGATFTVCRSNDEVGPIGDGAHSFSVRARDRAGNIDASPALHTWVVDTSTPDTTLLSGPIGATASTSATLTFLSPDAGPGASFECSLDGAAFSGCVSPVEYGALAMGVHTFSVRVHDANGNYDPTPATRTWTIDATPPETMITDGPSGVVAMASASISFTANESNVTYTCNLDGTPYPGCASPFNATGLTQGAHTFSVYATDVAGNADASPASASWTVDTVAPDVALTGSVTDGQTSGPYVSFQWTASEGTTECRIDGGAWLPCTSSFDYNHPAGASTFELRATDSAGNQTIVTRTWTVACAPPDEIAAVGVLHLGDLGQVLVNTTGGAGATLGATDQVEAIDPTFATSRFGDGLVFSAAEGDLVAWPLMAGIVSALTVELWSNPQALTGTRDVVVTGDGVFAIRITAEGTMVRYSVTAVDTTGVQHTATSGPYAAGQWHYVVASMSDPSLQLWVDGDVAATDARSVSISLASLQIGGTYGGGIDEVRLEANGVTTSDVLGDYCPASAVRL